jgi:hypothetical protein
MYRKHFALTQHPFGPEIAPQDLFPSAGSRELETRLAHLLDLRGIGLVTGDSGSGKTCSCRRVLTQLHTGLYRDVCLAVHLQRDGPLQHDLLGDGPQCRALPRGALSPDQERSVPALQRCALSAHPRDRRSPPPATGRPRGSPVADQLPHGCRDPALSAAHWPSGIASTTHHGRARGTRPTDRPPPSHGRTHPRGTVRLSRAPAQPRRRRTSSLRTGRRGSPLPSPGCRARSISSRTTCSSPPRSPAPSSPAPITSRPSCRSRLTTTSPAP